LTLVTSLGFAGALDDAADAARSVVTGQSPNPGPREPGEAVTLGVAPRPIERDTVVRTEPRYIVESSGRGVSIPVAAVIAVGALGLGVLGGLGSAALRRPPLPSPEPKPMSETARPQKQPDPHRLDVAAFEPMIIDEAVWVTHGRVRREGNGP
jgi:hypothetical protein